MAGDREGEEEIMPWKKKVGKTMGRMRKRKKRRRRRRRRMMREEKKKKMGMNFRNRHRQPRRR